MYQNRNRTYKPSPTTRNSNNSNVVAKPYSEVSLKIETSKSPRQFITDNADILAEELAKKILQEMQSNSNTVDVDVRPRGRFSTITMTVKLVTNERFYQKPNNN